MRRRKCIPLNLKFFTHYSNDVVFVFVQKLL